MTDVFAIRWVKRDDPSRPTCISAHTDAKEASRFVRDFLSANPDMRPEISSGKDNKTIGAHRLPVTSGTPLPLLQVLADQKSILFDIDPKNPSPFLQNYHRLRDTFTHSAAVPIERISVGLPPSLDNGNGGWGPPLKVPGQK